MGRLSSSSNAFLLYLFILVTNSSKIDKSFETILNWIFYAVAFTIILSQLGFSPMALFLSISGVILAFAFMIGSASSKYFEGLLFILVRRPYAIGDGIHVMGESPIPFCLFFPTVDAKQNPLKPLITNVFQVSKPRVCIRATHFGMSKM